MEPVSVVIPTFNRAALLPRTLGSVLAAVQTDDEIIVVDDGSTDSTADIVQAPDAPWSGRVRYLPVRNGGAGRARNAGIAAARHDLIAFADSDDTWLPCRLAVQRPLMSSEYSLAFCFSNFSQIYPDGGITPRAIVSWSGDTRDWDAILAPGRPYRERWPLPAEVPQHDADFRVHIGSMYRQELAANYINVNTLLARRSVVGEALHFGVDLPTFEDWECFARITRTGDCAYLDLDTACQLGHDGPRLTQASVSAQVHARIVLTERTWAADGEFMHRYGTEVQALLARQRLTLVRQLIRQGRRSEARDTLRQLDGAWIERLALMVPTALVTAVSDRLKKLRAA